MKRRVMVLAAVLALAVAGWLWGSPYLTVMQLKKAAQARDLATISAKIDYPAVRADLKAQLRQRLGGSESSGLGTIGGVLAERLGEPLVDAAITPEAMRSIFAAAAVARASEPGTGAKAGAMRVRREGLTRFALVPVHGAGPEVIFSLEGLTWRVTAVRLPAGRLL